MKQYIYKSSNFSSVGNFPLKKAIKVKLSDGKEKRVLALSTKTFEKFRLECKKAGKSFTLLGKTKLKALKKGTNGKTRTTKGSDAVFSISSTEHFEVRNKYSFVHTIGYLPVGENGFIEVVKFNPVVLLIALLMACAFVSASYAIITSVTESNRENPYIEEIDVPETNSDPNSTRYVMNVTMTIQKSDNNYIISGMGFENWNENKDLRLKIKLHPDDKDYIYDSEMVPYGKKIDADYLDTPVTEPGEYNTLAECYVYSSNGEKIAQTNVEITLIVN